MREIKFRAWNNKYGYEDWSSLTCCSYSMPEVFCQNRILEQYTGLKDKNDKEIYEGDIVNKRYHNSELFDGIGVIEMAEGCDSDGYNHGSWYGWKAGGSSLLDVNMECEIIGNIHENPELL
jgi:uncharacterized phage protein (TIGR01671 family)